MTHDQKDIFKLSEGDRWFGRNRLDPEVSTDNEIIDIIKSIQLSPCRVLEIGCANGRKLNALRKAFSCECYGIDPSKKALIDGSLYYPKLKLSLGTADSLDFTSNYFDTIIFGVCLYVCDRQDLFKIAYEADRCLKNNGVIIIKDFQPPYAYKNKYSDCKDMFSYKMDYSKMFKWNPCYTEISRILFTHDEFRLIDIPDERLSVVVLKKNEKYAYPDNAY